LNYRGVATKNPDTSGHF